MRKQRAATNKSRNRLLGVKPVLQKKRVLNDKHARANIPTTPFLLPDSCSEELKNAAFLGEMRALDLFRLKASIREREFEDERLKFEAISAENKGFFHLLMTVFLSRLFLAMDASQKKTDHVSRESKRNKHLVAAMAQREFAQTCLQLDEMEISRILDWSTQIGVKKDWWKSHFAGALSVARLSRLFLAEKAIVRFPRADEDIEWKIDLIVSFRGQSEGLCVQVKTDQRFENLQYKTFEAFNYKSSTKKDRLFVKGVKLFQDKFRGVWIPIEIQVGYRLSPNLSIEPIGRILDGMSKAVDVTVDSLAQDDLVANATIETLTVPPEPFVEKEPITEERPITQTKSTIRSKSTLVLQARIRTNIRRPSRTRTA